MKLASALLGPAHVSRAFALDANTGETAAVDSAVAVIVSSATMAANDRRVGIISSS
jgi:hypothetical protein